MEEKNLLLLLAIEPQLFGYPAPNLVVTSAGFLVFCCFLFVVVVYVYTTIDLEMLQCLLLIRQRRGLCQRTFSNASNYSAPCGLYMDVKKESERLLYMRLSQTKLNVDEHIHLKISVVSDVNASKLGMLVILISTLTGPVALSENSFNN